jgi:hypothetical protein
MVKDKKNKQRKHIKTHLDDSSRGGESGCGLASQRTACARGWLEDRCISRLTLVSEETQRHAAQGAS